MGQKVGQRKHRLGAESYLNMKILLSVFSALLLAASALGQTQGVTQRATNGVAFERMTVQSHINATNLTHTNTFAGRFQQGQGTTANGTGASAFGLGTRSSGSYSFSSGVGSVNSGFGAFASGRSNTIGSSALGSFVSGSFNNAVEPGLLISGYGNNGQGSNSFIFGTSNSAEDLTHNSFVGGQGITVQAGASNNFVWNGDPATPLTILTERSNSFTVVAPGGIFLNGPVTTTDAGGVSVYASNVVSGGVLPAATVSASTLTSGYVLGTDGTLRQWTNRVTLGRIDGNGGLGATNLVTGRIASTNVNVANTLLELDGAQNGATGTVIDYTTNNVSKFSVDSAGYVGIGTNIGSEKLTVYGSVMLQEGVPVLKLQVATAGDRLWISRDGTVGFISVIESEPLELRTANTTRLQFAGDGSAATFTVTGLTNSGSIQAGTGFFGNGDGLTNITHKSVLQGGFYGMTLTTTARYHGFGDGSDSDTIGNGNSILPAACTLTNFYVLEHAVGAGTNVAFTLMTNEVATHITAGALGTGTGNTATGSDLTRGVSVAAGTRVTVRTVGNNASASASNVKVGYAIQCWFK